jgi:hypothetical protein
MVREFTSGGQSIGSAQVFARGLENDAGGW